MTDPTGRPPDRPTAFLGIDAGGSRTTAVLTTADGAELGRAEGPSGAVQPGRVAPAAAAILETARRAAFGIPVTLPVAGAVIGAAGAGRALEREQLLTELGALARELRVMGDVELALHAAFGTESGVVVAAGTGSAAFARTPDGALHRAGGYGWQLGDEGGGYWLGRRALALAARDQDSVGEWSGLGVGIIRALELGSFDDLVRWAVTAAPAQIAALAPVLLAAARDGASPAAAVVREAADALAALVTVLISGFPGDDAVPVATTGRLLGPEAPLRAALAISLSRLAPRARLLSRDIDPALAAACLAAAAARA